MYTYTRRIVPTIALALALLGADAARADAPISGVFGESDGGSAQVVPGTGAMTYAVPFALPAARGTAQPSLSLRYASGAGTGEAGLGWGLDLPSIERTPLSGWPKYLDPASPYNTDTARKEDRYSWPPLTLPDPPPGRDPAATGGQRAGCDTYDPAKV